MKKILIQFLMQLIILAGIIGCSNIGDLSGTSSPTSGLTPAEEVAADKASLVDATIKGANSTLSTVTSNLTLSTSGSSGTTITWSSDNTSVVSITGTVTRQSGSNTTVILTATITKEGASDTKTFTVIVLQGIWQNMGTSPFSTGIYSGTDVLVDTNGDVYVLGASTSNYNLAMYKYNGTIWTQVGSTDVFDNSYSGVYTDIKKYGTIIYASCQTNSGSKITVSKFDGTSWSIVGGAAAATSINTASVYSMELDNNGVPYIAYQNSSPYVVCKKWDGSNWVTVGGANVTTTAPNTGVAIVFDTANTPYIAFGGSDGSYTFRLYSYDGSSWSEVCSGLTSCYNRPSVVFVGTVPYVAYRNTSGKSNVKKYESGSWSTVGTASFANCGSEQVLKYVGSTFYIGYDTGSGVSVRKLNGTAWDLLGTENGVVSSGYTNWSLGFAVKSDGVPVVTYNSSTSGSEGTKIRYY